MKKILYNGKKSYICLINKKTKIIYFLGIGITDEDKLNFINPFDIWDMIYIIGGDKEKILKDLNCGLLEKNYIFCFTNKKEALKFIKKNEPVKRKKLIKKYKNINILDIPLEDLKKMGVEIPFR